MEKIDLIDLPRIGCQTSSRLSYWEKKLGNIPNTEFPIEYPRSPVPDMTREAVRITIGKKLSKAADDLGSRLGTDLFITLLATFEVLLCRYSGDTDICIATLIPSGERHGSEGAAGVVDDILILRSDLGGNLSFQAALYRVKETFYEALSYKVPSEKIIEALMKEGAINRTQVSRILFAHENASESTGTASKFDLIFSFAETGPAIELTVKYLTCLFSKSYIERVLAHFAALLTAVVHNDNAAIGKLSMLTRAEEEMLRIGFNATRTEYPDNMTVLDLFRAQVMSTPDARAVVYEGQTLSYRELNEKAFRLAHRLRTKGVEAGSLVPICLDRGLEMIIGILGILKSGGAYVPIDPDYPPERVRYILEDIGASFAVSSLSCRVKLEEGGVGVENIITSDIEEPGAFPGGDSYLPERVSPEQAAYVIYTSGTTGYPKGVVVEHRGVFNRLYWGLRQHGLGPGDSVLQKTTFCFDVSVWELLLPLLAGGRLVLAEPDGQRDNSYLCSVIEQEEVTVVHFVPSALESFLHELRPGRCSTLRQVFCSGEALKVQHVLLFREKLPGVLLHNLYGPTEASIEVSYWLDEGGKGLATVPIGRPIANTQLYVMQEEGQLCGVGIPGELYIGGVQVARGYLNRPELTAERFVADSYSGEAGLRMYRTGDNCKWMPDGNIAYVGRKDQQIKIRGFRIEPGEVEHILMRSGMVRQAAVVALENEAGDKRMIGYLVPGAGFDKAVLQSFINRQLPEYMVPSSLVILEQLPLTSNGKIDKKALPKPGDIRPDIPYAGPRDEMEIALVRIWEQVLKIRRIGINNSFFDLGGHSLSVVSVLTLIKEEMNVALTVKTFFSHPTVARLGEIIKSTHGVVTKSQCVDI